MRSLVWLSATKIDDVAPLDRATMWFKAVGEGGGGGGGGGLHYK